ncbi:MAG: hypothetical protein ACODAU_12525 [Myxococcota bacterium]
MALKRTIPRVTTAALTLGGAAAGCGGDSIPRDIAEWCDVRTYCLGQGSAAQRACEDDNDYLLEDSEYYYGTVCGNALLDMWQCLSALSCGEIYDYDYYYCYPEIDAAEDYCYLDFEYDGLGY